MSNEFSSEETISHGICEGCSSDMLSLPIGSVRTFLDQLDYPILLIDSDTNIKAENRKLKELTGKSEVQIEGKKGGEVFNCINWREPGGCGKTIHCKACTIRKTVEETFETAKTLVDVKATLKVFVKDAEKHVSTLISTQKVSNYVLLIIKDFKIY